METIKENFIFKRAYHKGLKLQGKFLVVYRLKKNSGIRFGITVSKKLGKAVVRNSVRRKIRECLRYLSPYLEDGSDIIVVARSSAVNATFAELFYALKSQFEAGGLISEEVANYPY